MDLLDTNLQEATYLFRLHDVTERQSVWRVMWSFQTQVSHKLRTPLTLLTGGMQLLQTTIAPTFSEEQRSIMALVEKGASRIEREVQEIIQYINQTELTVILGQDFCQIAKIQPMVEDISMGLDIQAITFNLESTEAFEHAGVALSQPLLMLIFRELLSNAKKFHPLQNPKIEMAIDVFDGEVCLRVSDDGVHLPPTELITMWQPYYQIEKGFSGQVPGFGLGLAAVASFVWSAGGTCRSYNREEGAGVVIELVLPRITIS